MSALDNILKSVGKLAPTANLPQHVQRYKEQKKEVFNDPLEFTNIKPSGTQQVQKRLSDIVQRSAPSKTPEVESLLKGVPVENVEMDRNFSSISLLPSPVRTQLGKSINEYITNKGSSLQSVEEAKTLNGLLRATREPIPQQQLSRSPDSIDTPKKLSEFGQRGFSTEEAPEAQGKILGAMTSGVLTPAMKTFYGSRDQNIVQETGTPEQIEAARQRGEELFSPVEVAKRNLKAVKNEALESLEAFAWGVGTFPQYIGKGIASYGQGVLKMLEGDPSTFKTPTATEDEPVYKWLGEHIQDRIDAIRQVEDRVGELSEDAQFFFSLGSGAASLGLMYFTFGLAGAPGIGLSAMGLGVAGDYYDRARAAGESPEKAFALGSVAGLTTAAVNRVGWNLLFQNASRALVPKYVKAIQGYMTESLEEGADQAIQNIIEKIGFNQALELTEGVSESMLIGGIVGGFGATLMPNVSKQQIKELQEKGLTEAEATVLYNYIGERVGLETENIMRELDYTFRNISSQVGENRTVGVRGVEGDPSKRPGIEKAAPLPEGKAQGETTADIPKIDEPTFPIENLPPSVQDLYTRTREAKNLILNESVVQEEGADLERITSKVSKEEMLQMARETGVKDSKLLKKIAELSVQNKAIILKAGSMLSSSADSLSKKIFEYSTAKESMTTEQVQAMEEDIRKDYQSFQDIWLATRELFAEAGRTLRATGFLKDYTDVAQAYDRTLSSDEILDLAKKFAGKSPSEVLSNHLQTSWVDKVMEARNMGLVSNIDTHIVNMVSNLSNKMFSIPDTVFATMYDVTESTITGRDREMFLDEIKGDVIGSTIGMLDGLKSGLTVLLNNRTIEATGKAKDLGYREFTPGLTGDVIRLPGKLLMAGDEMMKGVWRSSVKWQEAYKIANKEGLRGNDKRVRVLELVNNPTEAMQRTMQNEALRGTFQEQAGRVVKYLNQMRTSDVPAARFLGKFIFPFLNTPANIFNQTFERSPFAPLLESWRKDFKAGGVKRSVAVGRMMSGTSAMIAVALGTVSGMITGAGPEDKKKKDALKALGWQEYSVKIGDKYYSYKRLEPLGTILGWTSTAIEQYVSDGKQKVFEEKLLAGLAGFLEVATDKSYITGTIDLIEFLEDPRMMMGRYASNAAVSFVPFSGYLRWLRNLNDEYQRVPKGIWQTLKNSLPGLSKSVPAKVNLWGQEVKRTSTVPFATPDVNANEIDKKLYELQLYLGIPSEDKLGWKMDSKTFTEYSKELGSKRLEIMEQVVSDPSFNALPPNVQSETLEKLHAMINDQFKIPALAKAIHTQLNLKDELDPLWVYQNWEIFRKTEPGFDDMSSKFREKAFIEYLTKSIKRHNQALEQQQEGI